jgi:methionyl-tRNA formyltransferase
VRIVLMGTSEFAVPTMLEIVKGGHTWSPASSIGIPVFTPTTLRTAHAENAFYHHAIDVAVVARVRSTVTNFNSRSAETRLRKPPASLLPRWRGAAPIQRAIMAGDAETGVDLMRMEAGLDTGPVAGSHSDTSRRYNGGLNKPSCCGRR